MGSSDMAVELEHVENWVQLNKLIISTRQFHNVESAFLVVPQWQGKFKMPITKVEYLFLSFSVTGLLAGQFKYLSKCQWGHNRAQTSIFLFK